MNNLGALKALYVALGGSAETVANMTLLSEVIAAMASLTLCVAPELPAVTAENNGAVLKVVNGKWAIGTDLTE